MLNIDHSQMGSIEEEDLVLFGLVEFSLGGQEFQP